MVEQETVNALITAWNNKYEKKADKVDDISGDFSSDNTKYPTVKSVKTYFGTKVTTWSVVPSNNNFPSEKLVKDSLDLKLNIADAITGNDIQSYVDGHDDDMTAHSTLLASVVQDMNASISNVYEVKSNKVTTLSAESTDTQYPSAKLMFDQLQLKQNAATAFSGNYNDLTNKPFIPVNTSDLTNDGANGVNPFLTQHQSLDSKTITVEKQAQAEENAAATYVIKQNGVQVGPKINIPLDFVLKEASSKTVGANPTQLETDNNLTTGDMYLDFVINTVDNSETNSHIIIPVNDLIDVYNADEVTLTLDSSTNTFKVKNNGIGTTQLAGSINTVLSYAEDYHNSVCKNITATDIANWNAKGTSNLTMAQIDAEIESYLSAITNLLNSS